MSTGCLYIVATPIGNLADITQRAVDTLKSVDLIAAEDTRHSQHLLQHYAITTPTLSLHEHNEQQRVTALIGRLKKGESIALISDAGTPLISDPGYRLVAAVHDEGLKVVPVLGACAAIGALSVSGLPTDRFIFEGFLPAKGLAREKTLAQFKDETRTVIFYESTHRIVNLIELMLEIFGPERQVTIARELSKTFETIKRASLAELLAWLTADSNQQRGEFVVLLQGITQPPQNNEAEYRRVLEILLQEVSLKQAVTIAVKMTGGSKKVLYQLALELR